jgi:hypothetical protein
MSIPTRILVWCYSQCLKLYPADFRTTFGEEMQTVLIRSFDERAKDCLWCQVSAGSRRADGGMAWVGEVLRVE